MMYRQDLLIKLESALLPITSKLACILPDPIPDESAEVIIEFWNQALHNFVLFIQKQLDYGSGNIARFGELGVMVRANDKIERLRTLLLENREAKNEPVEDTWRDLANYGVIGLLCHLGLWPEYKKLNDTDTDYNSTEWQDPNPPASP